MISMKDDKYTIHQDYHGDIKLTKNDTYKKVDLSKPTDILEHKSKQQDLIPTIYSNSNPPSVDNKFNNKICLTKPKDIISHNEEQHYQESVKFQFKSKVPIKQLMMKFLPILVLILVNLLSEDGLFYTIDLVIIYLILVKIKKQ